MNVLAIDPGTVSSGYVIVDSDTFKILDSGKVCNGQMLTFVYDKDYDECVIEMMQYYGKFMNAGQETFETCVWIGRFTEAARGVTSGKVMFLYRTTIKTHITGLASSKDAQVRQCLIDRFGGKGTKKDKGFFFGINADMFSAFALAVTHIET
jgi:Holliday junction resolvasome RuvABC endonuclease subunit